jgi:hypothetical protein
MKESIKNIAYLLSWIASYLAMTLAGEERFLRGEDDCVEGV